MGDIFDSMTIPIKVYTGRDKAIDFCKEKIEEIIGLEKNPLWHQKFERVTKSDYEKLISFLSSGSYDKLSDSWECPSDAGLKKIEDCIREDLDCKTCWENQCEEIYYEYEG